MENLALILAAIIAFIPATIARSKGRRFWLWYLFGFLLWIVALPVILFMGPAWDSVRRCAFCRELIRRDATRCRYCGAELALIGMQANG